MPMQCCVAWPELTQESLGRHSGGDDDVYMQGGEDKTVKWDTLEHSGVLFPPEYTPHGVRMLYDGKPVELTREQEEVCTLLRPARMQQAELIESLPLDWDEYEPTCRF